MSTYLNTICRSSSRSFRHRKHIFSLFQPLRTRSSCERYKLGRIGGVAQTIYFQRNNRIRWSRHGSTAADEEKKTDTENEAEEKQQRRIRWEIPVVVTVVGTVAAVWLKMLEKEQITKKMVTKPNTAGLASFGGPFTLTDQKGQKWTEENLKGQWSIMYFGYTHCPDICPDELDKISEGVAKIEEQGGKLPRLRPIMVTIDPERDDQQAMAHYCKDFHPTLVGLTGSPEQVAAMCKNYRIYQKKGVKEGEDEDYLMDHTIVAFLVNPRGKVVDYYLESKTPTDILYNFKKNVLAFEKAENENT